ncbi:hypothetical protein [Dictyobacter aurantiacus]|uniref:Uncharacterized protein n=1 Tax=Dictyobacter aurantiacus TaxID=1936993 RepID=A0A401ZQC3_9CHLR|nr:hypothetical protein [Dictyobacter aurantiacus]GCE09065.1 hypothetical protein KDAU_63940 [Dictyobacter aurantiacus]
MKKNDAGDFSVLYVEPTDDRAELFPVIAEQKKPIVLMLAEQVQTFQRPDDFTVLKHIKRQYDLTIIFVIAHSAQQAQLASRNGFPAYQSMEGLVQAVKAGQFTRQRTLARSTVPLSPKQDMKAMGIANRNTLPLGSKGQPAGSAEPITGPTKSIQPSPLADIPFPIHEEVPTFAPTPQLTFNRETPRPLPPVRPQQRISQPLPARPQLQQQRISQPLPPVRPQISQPLPPIEPPLPQSPPPPVRPPRQHPRRMPAVFAVITMALILAIIGSFLVFSHSFQSIASQTAAPTSIGRLAFTSSGQLNESSSQGIADQVVLDVHNLPAPAAGKKYYAWLLGDKNQNDPTSIALGALNINNGSAHLFYAGDAQHSNLLLQSSRVLVTEEDATMPPLSPSVDMHNWRYYGEFSSTPIKAADNTKNYSYLDHLRHLLAADPTLDELELPGGLNVWLYNNTGKLVEWTTSMRETWQGTKDSEFIRRQTLRVLAYLDGTTYLYKDLPPKSPLLVNERLARVGLVNVAGPNQQPPSYMDHIEHHMSGLLEADNTSTALRKQINDLSTSLDNINFWLGKVRQDAQKIVKMDDNQLKQPGTLTLINDMIDNTNHAFAGQLDPSTNQMRQGVTWLHDNMQALASIDLTPIKPDSSGVVPQIVPGNIHPRAIVLNTAKR